MGSAASTANVESNQKSVEAALRSVDASSALAALQSVLTEASTLPTGIKKEFVSFVEQLDGADRAKTTLLQLQQGVFRLLQGAAYRTYSPKFSLNFHTHKQVRSLPFLWTDFVQFVNTMMDLYRLVLVAEGLLSEQALSRIERLVNVVRDANTELQTRMKDWDPSKATKTQLSCLEKMEAAVEKREDSREDFTEYAQKALFQHSPSASVANTTKRMLDSANWQADENADKTKAADKAALKEKEAIDAQRELAGYNEGFSAEPENTNGKTDEVFRQQGVDFLESWNQVLQGSFEENLPGSMIQIGWWYTDFMPLLLDACSITGSVQTKLEAEQDNEAWFAAAQETDEFCKWGKDLVEAWQTSDNTVKTELRQAWRLTRHYLNGPLKLRERGSESGADHRETGDLSQYITFIDVYVNRAYIRDAEMRVSFPYYLGTATWIWKHTVAEIACTVAEKDESASETILDAFKAYMGAFVTMYACPYCRHHLNAYVILGREREMYPVEYLFLGWDPTKAIDEAGVKGMITVSDKLSAITDAESLRLFLWKLHNTVNSSIARSESWYQAEQDAMVTSRYWPNLDALCYRSENYGIGVMSATRVKGMMDVLKVASKLMLLRGQIIGLTFEDAKGISESVFGLIDKLDDAIVKSGFLQETYQFDSGTIDAEPKVTDADVQNVRHEDFTLT